MKETHSLTRSAGIISSATLLSRLLGLIRDILTAAFFGTGLAMSAFVVAFTIPNLFRRLFGEGALNAAFIPVFSTYLEKEGKKEAWRLASAVISLVAVFLAVLVLAGIILFWLINHTFTLTENYVLVLKLLQIMFPYLFFICLVGLAMGILNSFRHFTIPALAPVILNLVWIASLFLLCPRFGERLDRRIFGLAVGVVIAGFLQLLMQVPPLRRRGLSFRFILDLRHPGVRKIIYLMGPAVLGLAVVQLNIVIDRFLAMIIGNGAPAALYFGNRLVQFPLGVFGVALATAALPTLSSQVARSKFNEFKTTFAYVLTSVFLVTVPASLGLIVLRRPIIRLIFQYRQFGLESTEAVSWVLLFYSMGLFGFAGLKIVTQAFYSFQDTRTPVKVGVGAMLVNLVLNLMVVFNPWLRTHLREGGLALTTSLAGLLNLLFLIFLLRRRLGPLGGRQIFSSLGRIAIASGVMALSAWVSLVLIRQLRWEDNLPFRLLQVFLPLLIGVAVYLGMAAILKIRVASELRRAFSRKNVRSPNNPSPSEDQ